MNLVSSVQMCMPITALFWLSAASSQVHQQIWAPVSQKTELQEEVASAVSRSENVSHLRLTQTTRSSKSARCFLTSDHSWSSSLAQTNLKMMQIYLASCVGSCIRVT